MPSERPAFESQVSLASLTTLELGGPTRSLVTPESEPEVVEVEAWATGDGLPLFALGGGSNVVAGDEGFPGVVLRTTRLRGMRTEARGGEMWVHVQAGEPWDDFVESTAAAGWAGLECLAGIPGTVGATPIQNVGAYGQEVAETIRAVRVLDRAPAAAGSAHGVRILDGDACGFGYRASLFRAEPARFIVLEVTFALRPGDRATLRYPELSHLFSSPSSSSAAAPSLVEVTRAVRTLRRGKSMVLEPGDPNRRSVGSFFMNPVLPAAEAEDVCERAVRVGAAVDVAAVPRFPDADGRRAKLSAAWLIEKAGFARGTRRGAVGLSSRHSLALVHHGGGTTAALLAFAREIQATVHATFGVTLHPEPIFLGTTFMSG